ncbi:uncharacterized protein LOC126682258 [Mercurialis annua]|uniref:uncharacterized protein LOC126682258 n=1 Tax=Mercurialis annua TaxID=3986 RepID=UPI0021607874|nr:uncharacterized protein LOC126682258 [Mercurialis annua]
MKKKSARKKVKPIPAIEKQKGDQFFLSCGDRLEAKIVQLILCYGGRIELNEGKLSYVGGEEEIGDPLFSLDKLSYFNMLSYLHYFEIEKGDMYLRSNSIELIRFEDDRCVLGFWEELIHNKEKKIYVCVDYSKFLEQDKQPILEGEGEGEPSGNVLHSQVINVEDDLTFDDLCISIEGHSDDDDLELQEARQNVINSRQDLQGLSEPSMEEGGDEPSDEDIEEPMVDEGANRGVEEQRVEGVIDSERGAEEQRAEAVIDSERGAEEQRAEPVIDSERGAEDVNESEPRVDRDCDSTDPTYKDDSVYYSSSDVGSHFSENEDDFGAESHRDESIRVQFDATTEIPQFAVGMFFSNLGEVRYAIARYAVMKGMCIRYVKNDLQRVRAKCMVGCPWVMQVSPHNADQNWTIKTYEPEHRCTRSNKVKFCDSNFLSKRYKTMITNLHYIKLKDFKSIVRSELKQSVSLNVCRHAKTKIITELMGFYRGEYASLNDYAEVICHTNPGTTCFVKSTSENPEGKQEFHRFYVCFSACKRGWLEGCRKVIGIDGCFLKGICKGQLLIAVGRDGNNQMFPIAWGVVLVENKDNWSWFLRMIQYDLQLEYGEGYAVISDMQKGLESAVKDILPQAEHRRCARHVYANWAKKWRGDERKKAFWSCAKATTFADLNVRLTHLGTLGNNIVNDALSYEIETWSKVYFDTSIKCDVVDNNLAETFNGWILEPRCKSVITMLEDIRVKVMNRLWNKRDSTRGWITDVSPRALEVVEKNKQLSYDWEVEFNGDYGYEIAWRQDRRNKHTVDINRRVCTCREWDLTGIPCRHGVCAIYAKGHKPEEYVHHLYNKETYLKAYGHTIQPVPGKDHWVRSEKGPIEPPPFKKLPGRPKKTGGKSHLK